MIRHLVIITRDYASSNENDEWEKYFLKRMNDKTKIKSVIGKNGGKLCEYYQAEKKDVILYLMHGCARDWWADGQLCSPRISNILGYVKKQINNRMAPLNEKGKLGFLFHSKNDEDMGKIILENTLEMDVQFIHSISSEDAGENCDGLYDFYKIIIMEDGTLNKEVVNKFWWLLSKLKHLISFHSDLTSYAVCLEAVRLLIEQEEHEKAVTEYKDIFKNDNLGSFIAGLSEHQEYETFCLKYNQNMENRIKKKVEELKARMYAIKTDSKQLFTTREIEVFITWFNEFSRLVAEELS